MKKTLENNLSIRNWVRVALGNFLLAACLGATLRLAFVTELSWLNYRHILHTHSHIAMLGWLYLIFYALFVEYFLPKKLQKQPFYSRLFWVTQFSVLGMLFSFPFQGYGPVSISFSTLHILCAYTFCWKFFKDLAESKSVFPQSRIFVKLALGFQIVSTLGLWGMGPIMATELRVTAWYNMAVQFYLHFQFNGWFLFAALALFFQLWLKNGLILKKASFRVFTWLMILATILTYSLILAWVNPEIYFFLTNSLGVSLQLVALYVLLGLIRSVSINWRALFSNWELRFFQIALISFIGKIVVQALLIVPYLAKIGFTIRNFMIGFIHLFLLGMISHFVIAIAARENLIKLVSKTAKWGVVLFLLGFLSSELVLFFQGTLLWGGIGFLPLYYEILFACSAMIPIGIVLILSTQWGKEKEQTMDSLS